ncbi:MAG TPA: outer membrane beta-barrel protein [Steroidobacteraceae bacterium]|nr:outer membrane beta-barrel protein [Steroidobacteraceae bacterium]
MRARNAFGWRGITWLAALLLAPAAFAQSADRAGTWETRLDIVYNNSADWDFTGGTTAEIDSDTSFLIGFGYHLNDNLELGGNFTFGQTDYSADIAGDVNNDEVPDTVFGVRGEYESTSLVFDATWNFLPGAFTPFVSANAGWAWVDTNIATGPPQTGCWWDPWWGYVCSTFQDTKSLDGFTYGFDVGARYDFSDSLAAHASYRMMWVDLDNADGTPDIDGFRIGIGWKF